MLVLLIKCALKLWICFSHVSTDGGCKKFPYIFQNCIEIHRIFTLTTEDTRCQSLDQTLRLQQQGLRREFSGAGAQLWKKVHQSVRSCLGVGLLLQSTSNKLCCNFEQHISNIVYVDDHHAYIKYNLYCNYSKNTCSVSMSAVQKRVDFVATSFQSVWHEGLAK